MSVEQQVAWFTFEFVRSEESGEAVLQRHHGPPEPTGDTRDDEPVPEAQCKETQPLQPRSFYLSVPLCTDPADGEGLHGGRKLLTMKRTPRKASSAGSDPEGHCVVSDGSSKTSVMGVGSNC